MVSQGDQGAAGKIAKSDDDKVRDDADDGDLGGGAGSKLDKPSIGQKEHVGHRMLETGSNECRDEQDYRGQFLGHCLSALGHPYGSADQHIREYPTGNERGKALGGLFGTQFECRLRNGTFASLMEA